MKLLAVIRLVLFAMVLGCYAIIMSVRSLIMGDRPWLAYRQWVAHTCLKIVGVKVHLSGQVPTAPALVIGNHIAYIDPFLILKYFPVSPIAKIEVRRWPLIGKVCSLSDVVFVKRESATSRRNTREAIGAAFMKNKSVLVYPEGTTTTGQDILPLRPGVFNLAATHNMPIVVATVAYHDERAPFVGDDEFLSHFMYLFSRPRVNAFLHFSEPFTGVDGKELKNETEARIRRKLRELNHANP